MIPKMQQMHQDLVQIYHIGATSSKIGLEMSVAIRIFKALRCKRSNELQEGIPISPLLYAIICSGCLTVVTITKIHQDDYPISI